MDSSNRSSLSPASGSAGTFRSTAFWSGGSTPLYLRLPGTTAASAVVTDALAGVPDKPAAAVPSHSNSSFRPRAF
jgi:hypothetical protein